jgi:two-component system, OmpR family, sensor histidine kinase SenX3
VADVSGAQWLDRRTATRIAFWVIAVFVLAQVTWWVIFQDRVMRESSEATLAAWERDVRTAAELLAAEPDALATLLQRYPHLRVADAAAAGGPRLEVDPAARREVLERARSARRMLAFEGPFFAAVVVVLLLFIASSLRSERELKRRQQNFLGAVTHEFKTPISTLRLLVQTVRLRSLSPQKQQDYLRRMETEIDRLERTSEQVLASARLEQASEPPPLAEADLNHAVQGIVGRLRPGLELRGADLDVRYSPEPLPVSIDVEALTVVVSNLLDNAVKYSPGERKPITLGLERDGDLALLHVDDQGVGLLPADRERVFDRFYRTGDEMTRGSSGVGLGLHLVKTISEAMRGWVKVGDTPSGRGTRFTVVLPRRVAAPSAASGADAPAADAAGGTA